MSRSRVSIGEIPNRLMVCKVQKPCVYRAIPGRWCDEPRTNKGNGDAACHRMNNKDLLKLLENRP